MGTRVQARFCALIVREVMAKVSHLTAIDIGTDKCATLIAASGEKEGESLRIVGVSVVPSRGMRKSQIVDLEQVMETITESVEGAERMAGMSAHQVVISISGAHIASYNSKGVVAVSSQNQEIIPDDVARVIEAARALSLPPEKKIIHVIPRDFTVDSQTGIKDPVGMTGIRLEAEAHIITGMTTALNNLTKCVQDIGLELAGFTFSGLAAAEAVLTETEKELGVVVVDIGAGTTSVCAYTEGALAFSTALPIGARHITQDIALGCRLSLENAEKIKVALSEQKDDEFSPKPGESKDEVQKRRKKADEVDLKKLGIDSTEILSRKHVVEGIMLPRMKEIFTLLGQKLAEENLLEEVPAGVVITGGGAETTGIVEAAKRTLNLPARVGRPRHIQGVIDDLHRPTYATSMGLILMGLKQVELTKQGSGFAMGSLFKNANASKILDKIIGFAKSLLP